jgi:hypothetical protein
VPTTAAIEEKAKTGRFNVAWFKGKVADLQITQRAIARQMALDPSAVNLMLHGRRKMDVHEAAQLAQIFGVSLETLAEQAGIDINGPAGGRVPVVGWIDPGGYVHRRKLLGPKFVRRPEDLSPNAEAYRHQGGTQDGWLVFTEGVDASAEDCADTFCLIKEPDGRECLKYVRKGYGPGTFFRKDTPEGRKEEEGGIVSGRPIRWIKCF